MAETKVGCNNVIVNPDNPDFYLLIQETSPHKRGLFNLPGGSRESRESLIECAVREAEEETGLLTEPIGLLGLYEYHKVNQLHVAFASTVVVGEPTPSEEHPIVEYFSFEDITRFNSEGKLRSERVLDAIRRHRDGRIIGLEALSAFMFDDTPNTSLLTVGANPNALP
jgi:8-oxo-dGTP pyrophosphatase MutT (NUDIX family)